MFKQRNNEAEKKQKSHEESCLKLDFVSLRGKAGLNNTRGIPLLVCSLLVGFSGGFFYACVFGLVFFFAPKNRVLSQATFMAV